MPLDFGVVPQKHLGSQLSGKEEIQRQYETGKRVLKLRAVRKELADAQKNQQIQEAQNESRKVSPVPTLNDGQNISLFAHYFRRRLRHK